MRLFSGGDGRRGGAEHATPGLSNILVTLSSCQASRFSPEDRYANAYASWRKEQPRFMASPYRAFRETGVSEVTDTV
ncbi:MAG: hypothetical protein IKT16_03300 [Desulfovibrio sp.]|nr:hypothetical protein [Desulfovibrio sp.]